MVKAHLVGKNVAVLLYRKKNSYEKYTFYFIWSLVSIYLWPVVYQANSWGQKKAAKLNSIAIFL